MTSSQTLIILCRFHAGNLSLRSNLATVGCIGSISIHTLARGVTVYIPQIVVRLAISIHTPARGVTGADEDSGGAGVGFQSTLPQGE